MADNRPFEYGDKVIMTDEFGKEVLGTIMSIKAFDVAGQYGIDTKSYGVYSRSAEEMRHAEHWEVHQFELNQRKEQV